MDVHEYQFIRKKMRYLRMERLLLTIKLAAKYLGISPKTIRKRLGKKAPNLFPVKPKRIGKRVLFDIKDLDIFIDSLHREE